MCVLYKKPLGMSFDCQWDSQRYIGVGMVFTFYDVCDRIIHEKTIHYCKFFEKENEIEVTHRLLETEYIKIDRTKKNVHDLWD